MEIPFIISEISDHSFNTTLEILKKEIANHGASIFATVDHRANALSVNLALKPTTVIMFGNPKVGTPLMEDIRLIGLELPLKFLVWEDDDSNIVVSYPNLYELAKMYGVSSQLSVPVTLAMDNLADIISKVVTR